MKEKTANLLKIVGIVYLGLRLFSMLASDLVLPLIDRRFSFTFNNGTNIFIFISIVIGLVCYLLCSNRKPVPVGLLIAAFAMYVLASLVSNVFSVISNLRYAYYSSFSPFTFIVLAIINLMIAIVWSGVVFVLVPMLISSVLCPNSAGAGGVSGRYQAPGMVPGVNGCNRVPVGQPPQATPGYRAPEAQAQWNRPPVGQPQYAPAQPVTAQPGPAQSGPAQPGPAQPGPSYGDQNRPISQGFTRPSSAPVGQPAQPSPEHAAPEE